MNSPLLITLAVASALLTSCGNVQTTLAQARENTVATLRTAKEKTLGRDDTKVRLTKADPSRFLPVSTNAKTLLEQGKPKPERARLLAKNEQSSSRTKNRPADLESLPPLELPPLPKLSKEMDSTGAGILPALDEAKSPLTEGESAALPPLPTPEEVLAEAIKETSA